MSPRISSSDIAQIGKRPPIENMFDGRRIKFRVEGNLQNPMNHYWSWKQQLGWKNRWQKTTKPRAEEALRIAVQMGWRHAPSVPKRVLLHSFVWRLFDSQDGLRSCLKPVVDSLKIGLINDDDDKSGHLFEYTQKATRGWRGVEITVEIRR